MNPLDDLFRDGLRGRTGKVPTDMWARISAEQSATPPEGETLDELFAGKLAERSGEVPADMWARIAATGATAATGAAALDQQFAAKLKDRLGEVPAGTWERIWRRVVAPAPAFNYRPYLVAVSALLLLLLGGTLWWQFGKVGQPAAPPSTTEEPAVIAEIDAPQKAELAAAAGAVTLPGADAPVPAGEVVGASPAKGGANSTAPSTVTPSATWFPDEERAQEPSQAEPDQAAATLPQTLAKGTVVSAETTLTNSAITTPASTERITLPALSPLAQAEIAGLSTAANDFAVKRAYRPRPGPGGGFRAAPRHRLQTELLFGVAYANQLFSVADENNRPLLTAREISEYAEASYQITLRTNFRLGERLLLTGGLTYAEIRNQFESTHVVNGTPTDLRINNSIRQLEVPLLLGYRLPPGKRLHVSLNAGPIVNLTTSARGIFLHPDASAPLDLAIDGNYRKNTGIGFMTSLSTIYKIGNQEPFLLVVEPFFKSYLNPFSVEDAPLQEKYWVAGLQLGVRKGF